MSEEAVKATGEVDAAKGGYSEAASAIMESITSGLDKRQELLVSKLDNKIDGYVDKVVKNTKNWPKTRKQRRATPRMQRRRKSSRKKQKVPEERQKIKNYANKYTSTFMDALKEGTEKAYSKIEDDLDKKLDEIAEKYQKAYDRIISFRDDMKKKNVGSGQYVRPGHPADTSRAVSGRSEKAQGQDTGKPDGSDPWHGPERGRQLRGAPECDVGRGAGGVQEEMGTVAGFVRNLQQGIFSNSV